jgi:probable HAF family extracellular repeat protein
LTITVTSLISPRAQAQSKYTALAIAEGSGSGVNNLGDVVGTLSANTHAFLFKNHQVTDLGAIQRPNSYLQPGEVFQSYGFAVNDSDHVAGQLINGSYAGTTFDSFLSINGKMTDIAHGYNDGGFASSVGGINNAGDVIGSYDAAGMTVNPPALPRIATCRAFRYRNGTLYNVGTLGGHYSLASGLNSAGQIVGISTTVDDQWQAFVFNNQKFQIIGGAQSNYFSPWAINDNGWVTGTVTSTPTTFTPPNVINAPPTSGNAVLYANGTIVSLGSLPGFTGSHGLSINNSGTIIGSLNAANGGTGVFIYSGGTMYNLNTLVDKSWTILSVGHINDAGQIAATGSWQGSKVTWALLLTPAH